MKSLYSRKKRKPMPKYTPSPDEVKWYSYCVNNNIRISPTGIQGDQDHWHICINIGPYRRGEKQNKSPEKYNRNDIWPKYYEFCKYYYDKYKQ